MGVAKLIILDECNCKFEGVDVATRRKMTDKLKFFLPYARNIPAVRLGRWDGSMTFCDVGGRTYITLLDRLLPILEAQGYTIELEDRRVAYDFKFDNVASDSYAHVLWPEGHPLAGQPIEIKDHQVEAINTYLSNPVGVLTLPTGSGKTIVTAILSHKVEPYGRTVVIVPSTDLVTQTEEDYINFGLDVGVFYGGRKEYNKKHTICTWQSLDSLYKKTRGSDEQLEVDIRDFFSGVVAVIVDECHRAKGASLRRTLGEDAKHIPIRWGMTGTIPKDPQDETSIIATVGPLLGKVRASTLQDAGILANLHINIKQLQDVGKAASGDYQTELKWLTTNPARIATIVEQIQKIAESGNTMVLVDRLETGKMMQELIPDSVFVSGQMKSKDRKEEYKEIQGVDGKILLASFGVASTGVSINRIFNLVLIEPGKSFVRVIQSIGRGLRVAQDKDFVNVYDICSNTKYSRRHLTERKSFYKEAEYPFTVTKVVY